MAAVGVLCAVRAGLGGRGRVAASPRITAGARGTGAREGPRITGGNLLTDHPALYEARFPDPAANPYLAFAALLMAGLDGIARQLDPGEAMDRNLYDLPPEQIEELPTVCGTLEQALDALDQDRGFLTESEVFTDDLIDAHIALKRAEIETVRRVPHPVEYQLYYSV